MSKPALTSERVVVQAPMSYVGSAKRVWKLTGRLRLLTVPIAILLVLVVWIVVCAWYAAFGLLVVPWRLFRRWGRSSKREKLRHSELLDRR